VIVAAVDAQVLARLTGSKPPKRTDYSPSMFSVRLESSDASERAYETVIFGEEGEPTIRLHVAPETPSEWIVHADVPSQGADWDAEELRKLTATRLAIPAAALAVRDVFTPADRERLTGTPGGSVHGPAVSSLSSAILRSPTVQPIKGLLHVGGSSRPGPGIAFAALSAWNAAEVLRPTRV